MRNWSDNKITLILIRHGATRANREHRYLGKSEESLSEEGAKELIEYRIQKRYPKIEYLFTSPMKRCMQTAEIIYPERKSVIIPEWEEMDFGAFEGKNYLELKEDRRYQEWIDSNGTLPFPEGESREDFCFRCDQGLKRMYERMTDGMIDRTTDRTTDRMDEQFIKSMGTSEMERTAAGIVVHGGTIMALLSQYYGGEYFDYQVPNGGGYTCTLSLLNHELRITELKHL